MLEELSPTRKPSSKRGARVAQPKVVRALASHQCCPGFTPGVDAICGLSLLLVLSFAPRGFPPVLRFSPLHKNQRFQLPILPESGRRRTTLWMCYLQIIIYLFISLQGMTRTVLTNCPISVEIRTVDSQSDLRILL